MDTPDTDKQPHDDHGLGRRLREIRLGQGKSLRALAREAGISHGLLSQVENGKTRPSFKTLLSLANTLRVPLAELFPGPERRNRVVRRSDPARELHTSLHATDLLLTPDNSGDFSVVLAHVVPQSTSGGTYHHPGGQELVYILHGELVLIVGEEEFLLASGDAITLMASEPHGWRNESSGVVEAIWVVSNRATT